VEKTRGKGVGPRGTNEKQKRKSHKLDDISAKGQRARQKRGTSVGAKKFCATFAAKLEGGERNWEGERVLRMRSGATSRRRKVSRGITHEVKNSLFELKEKSPEPRGCEAW